MSNSRAHTRGNPALRALRRGGRSVLITAATAVPGATRVRGKYARALQHLERDELPANLRAVCQEVLNVADQHLERGDLEATTQWYDKFARLVFHPSYFGTLAAEHALNDDDGFLDMLYRSRTGQLLTEPRDEAVTTTAQPGTVMPQPGRKLRVLVCCYGGRSFINPLVRALQGTGLVEVRQLDLAPFLPRPRLVRPLLTRARLNLALTGARIPTPDRLKPDLEWADTVFVEWGHVGLVWMSLLETFDARLITRIHRFEASTDYPHLADYSQVDSVIFVAEHIRQRMMTSVRALHGRVRAPRIDNLADLTQFERPKVDGFHRRIVMVGWTRIVKDVEFALDIVEQLQESDPTWQLLLVGADLDLGAGGPRRQRIERRIKNMRGAVQRLGHRSDVPEVFSRAAFVLSTSLMEGTHESIWEGAASGCVPIVRNWPQTVPWGGAASVFPPTWIVDTRAEAVERIQSLAQDQPGWRNLSSQARSYVLERRDVGRIVSQYVDVLAGGQVVRP